MGKRTVEGDVLIPALKVVRDNPNCTTSDIIIKLQKEMVLYPGDLEILAGRNDTKFSQVVRNLTGSHYDYNDFGRYTNRSNDRHAKFTLNQEGIAFLIKHDNDIILDEIEDYIACEEINNEVEYVDNIDVDTANNRMPIINEGSRRKRYKTDAKLAKTALLNCKYKCEYSNLIEIPHVTFDAKRGNKYLEAHHLIPMKAQKDFIDKNLDRLENIVGLCPICHAAVHHGTLNEKIRILKPLYELRIKLLNECNHKIDISFEDLINKYYV